MSSLQSELYWLSARGEHWGFWVKYVSRYWELTLRGGDGLQSGPTGGRKVFCYIRICLVPWERRQSVEKPHQVFCYRAAHETWAMDLEERKES